MNSFCSRLFIELQIYLTQARPLRCTLLHGSAPFQNFWVVFGRMSQKVCKSILLAGPEFRKLCTVVHGILVHPAFVSFGTQPLRDELRTTMPPDEPHRCPSPVLHAPSHCFTLAWNTVETFRLFSSFVVPKQQHTARSALAPTLIVLPKNAPLGSR
jgi:hypothetical protein